MMVRLTAHERRRRWEIAYAEAKAALDTAQVAANQANADWLAIRDAHAWNDPLPHADSDAALARVRTTLRALGDAKLHLGGVIGAHRRLPTPAHLARLIE